MYAIHKQTAQQHFWFKQITRHLQNDM